MQVFCDIKKFLPTSLSAHGEAAVYKTFKLNRLKKPIALAKSSVDGGSLRLFSRILIVFKLHLDMEVVVPTLGGVKSRDDLGHHSEMLAVGDIVFHRHRLEVVDQLLKLGRRLPLQ